MNENHVIDQIIANNETILMWDWCWWEPRRVVETDKATYVISSSGFTPRKVKEAKHAS